jgi:hypothetical protein
MAETRLLDRLTASDLFLLLWDDYGWPSDIGGLAICDGTSLLGRDGQVRIEAVRTRLEPRLHLVPASGSCSTGPGWGWAGHYGSTPPPSTSPTTSGSIRWPHPAAKSSYWPHARNWRAGGWIQPGRYGSCGCCPACHTGGWART